ncbi:MAG TPA: hypothetical protein VGF16_16650 [Bryobacteraceae bacterium]|jgi:hypothetical protein
MIPADDPRAPKYWVNESSGVLVPVVEKYLRGEPLDANQLGIMRAYLRQWVQSPAWDQNPHGGRDELNRLRGRVSAIDNMRRLDEWIDDAVKFGMDPL